MKIYYASGNKRNSKYQCDRFLQNIGTHHIVNIAAYEDYKPNCNINWTLDSLHSICHPEKFDTKSDEFEVLKHQIKTFNPDLVISDFEYFTSMAALDLNIPLWQYSSSLVAHGLIQSNKNYSGIFNNFAYLLFNNRALRDKYLFLIKNSNKNIINSHLVDTPYTPEIRENFIWSRPYHKIGKLSEVCKHNLVARIEDNNRKAISFFSKENDVVIFSKNVENYKNLITKNSLDENEYYCNLANASAFICRGESQLLADAFYNKKYSFIILDDMDKECVINGSICQHLLTGKIVKEKVDFRKINDIEVEYNPIASYIHEYIDEFEKEKKC